MSAVGHDHPASIAYMNLIEEVKRQQDEEWFAIAQRRRQIKAALLKREMDHFLAEHEFMRRDPMFRWWDDAVSWSWQRHPDYILIKIEELEQEWAHYFQERKDGTLSTVTDCETLNTPIRCKTWINALWTVYDRYYGLGTTRRQGVEVE